MTLGSTPPLLKMSTGDVPGGKGGRCVRLTIYHHIVPMSRNLGALTLLDPSGPAWTVMGVLYLYLCNVSFKGKVVISVSTHLLPWILTFVSSFNPLNAELNPICHLLALLAGSTIVDVSRLRVKFNIDFYPTGVLTCFLFAAIFKPYDANNLQNHV
jgi:hypothetical protein